MDDRRFQKLSLKPLSRLGVDRSFEQLSVQDKYNRRERDLNPTAELLLMQQCSILKSPFHPYFIYSFTPREVLNIILTDDERFVWLCNSKSPSDCLLFLMFKEIAEHIRRLPRPLNILS